MLLLYRGAHVNMQDKVRWVEWDICSGTHCDIHLPFQDGRTALINSSWLGHMECVRLLLYRGAEVNIQDMVSTV